jgi:hypothetical protein
LRPLLFISILILSLSSCSKDLDSFSLNEEIKLDYGETAKIESEDIQIEFVDVLEESRCPPKVLCIWAGLVRVKLNINGGDPVYLNLGDTPSKVTHTFDDYELTLLDVSYPSDKDFGMKEKASIRFVVREI